MSGVGALLATGAATSLCAEPVADFYRGKTLSFVSGFTPNGEYDSQLRLLARHIGRHVPGQPQVVASSMPGAGSMIIANHLYNKAPADGTFVGMFAMQVAVEPFLKSKAALFDPFKFNWIGSLARNHQYCIVSPTPGVPSSLEEMLRKDAKETLFGVSAPSSEIYRNTAVVKKLLGAHIRLISGYLGMPAIKLAMQRGEVGGVCGLTLSALRRQHGDDLKSGKLKVVLQMSGKQVPDFGKVPHVLDYAGDGERRKLFDYFFGTMTLGRPIAVPAAVPADRVDALRAAFHATLKDKEFIADAGKINIELSPATGKELADQMEHLSKYPAAFFDKVRTTHQ